MDVRLVVYVAVVSGLAALGFVLLRDGLSTGETGVVVAGAAVSVLALGGIVVLAAAVIAADGRSDQERR